MKVLDKTESLCPTCVDEKRFNEMVIPATVYEENGKVWIKKKCEKHGEVKEIYWDDYELYKRAKKYEDKGVKIENPTIKKPAEEIKCPNDCGLCYRHKSHTALGNIVITNRCDMSCWYCFFYQKKGDPVYEPTKEMLKEMFRSLRDQKPVGCNAVQLTGGEPTVREDFVEIVKLAKEAGFDHVQPNINSISIANNPQLVKDLVKAGANTFYTSFDGLTPKSNPKNYWEFPRALENYGKAEAGIVIVPTVIKGINDDQLGNIMRFGFGNMGVVRGIVYQPVSLVGMMPRHEREKQRITIPEVVRLIEEQTDGQVAASDFYTIPIAAKFTDFIQELQGKGIRYRLSAHFACGKATYIFKDKDKLVPITRFIDVEGLVDYLSEQTENLKRGANRTVVKAKLLLAFKKFVDMKNKPNELKISSLIVDALKGGTYDSLRGFHHNSLFVGLMHFMDPYNYDIKRVEQCCIHYGMPDGKVVPFCAFNILPELYRDKTQREFSMDAREWEKKTGKKLIDDKYQRTKLTPEQEQKIHEFYAQYIRK